MMSSLDASRFTDGAAEPEAPNAQRAGYAPARLLPADAAAESARRRRCVAGDSGSCDVE